MLWEAMQVSECRLQNPEARADKDNVIIKLYDTQELASEVSPVVLMTT